MRIDEQKPDITTYGMGEEQSFSVGNLGRIFKILRNQMYAHPIKAIVREITSNARDAHREVGEPGLPIQIRLPSEWNSSFVIKDFGPGISPDRMSSVFLKYGNSTKTEDDIQTGGFGLGAKTPFAYSDQFQITTISKDDNDINHKRVYIAYIDETEEGKMRLVSSVETDEQTGTEISIPIKRKDFYKINEAVSEVCQYWDPRPEIIGNQKIEWPESKEAILKGDGWELLGLNKYGYSTKNVAIVDGIEYDLAMNNIDGLSSECKSLFCYSILLRFETGDVRLSANREELQYDEKTCPMIISRLNNCLGELQRLAQEKLATAKSYLEAVSCLLQFKSNLPNVFPKGWTPTWNGYEVSQDGYFSFFPNTTVFSDPFSGNVVYDWHYKINCFYFKENKNYVKGLSQREGSTISLHTTKSFGFILNDLSDSHISRSRVEHYLKINDLGRVYVITASNGNIDEAVARMSKENQYKVDINLFNPVLMSSIITPKNRKKRKHDGVNRSLYSVFKYDATYKANRGCDDGWRPIEVDLKNEQGCYVIIKGRSNTRYLFDNKPVTNDQVFSILTKTSTQSVYGIRERDLDKIGPGWVSLEEVLKKHIETKLQSLNLTMQNVQDILSCRNLIEDYEYWPHNVYREYYAALSDSSCLKQVMQLYCSLKSLFHKCKYLGDLIKAYDPSIEGSGSYLGLTKKMQDLERVYPLTKSISHYSYSYSYDAVSTKEVAQYVLLIDKDIEEQKALGLDKTNSDGYHHHKDGEHKAANV